MFSGRKGLPERRVFDWEPQHPDLQRHFERARIFLDAAKPIQTKKVKKTENEMSKQVIQLDYEATV